MTCGVHRWRDTLSAHNSRPRKIPGRITFVHEDFTVKNRVFGKKKKMKDAVLLFSFSNFTSGFHAFHLKKLKIIQYDFRTGAGKRI